MSRGKNVTKGFRLHIGIFGRRNAGKSSLLNAITRQAVSIVSEVPGTTTDPVEKPMELLPLGPVVFIDTAGLDDQGSLGGKRVEKTRRVLDRADLAIVAVEADSWTPFEQALLEELEKRQIAAIVAFTKTDSRPLRSETVRHLAERGTKWIETAAPYGRGIEELREALLASAPEDLINASRIASDIVAPGELAVLVIPIDKEAPKGRIILPQVQTIRDLLDGEASCLVCTDKELRSALEKLRDKPRLVVTDSQAFAQVARDTPADVLMTSFSILFARLKGDLLAMVEGALAIRDLKPGDRVLVAEACTHHPIDDDIGRVKIPAWLRQKVGGDLDFVTVQGGDFPQDLSPYKLVVHCGACMFNRKAVLTRILACRRARVPISNYGLVIAASLGILERALQPFPAALDVLSCGLVRQ
jgi:[FeFe] hydrogenase H-cluster maturation GTPase HydF